MKLKRNLKATIMKLCKNFEHSRNGCFAGGFPGNGYFERADVLQQAYDAGSKVH